MSFLSETVQTQTSFRGSDFKLFYNFPGCKDLKMEVSIEMMDFVGCNAMHFGRCPRKFQRNVVLPPSSGSKRKTEQKTNNNQEARK
jgi:hypothetical protein